MIFYDKFNSEPRVNQVILLSFRRIVIETEVILWSGVVDVHVNTPTAVEFEVSLWSTTNEDRSSAGASLLPGTSNVSSSVVVLSLTRRLVVVVISETSSGGLRKHRYLGLDIVSSDPKGFAVAAVRWTGATGSGT